MDRIVQPWRGNSLTIEGKVTLINTLVISQFVYLMIILLSPNTFFFLRKDFLNLYGIINQLKLRGTTYTILMKIGVWKNLHMMNISLKAGWIMKM